MERRYRLRRGLPIAIALCMMLTFVARSQIVDIEKATNGHDADAAPGPSLNVGDAITWTYVVTNTFTAELTSVAVTDDQLGPITCPKTTLAVGESMTCTANGTATAGPYANVGTVTATVTTPSGDRQAFAEDPSHYVGVSATPAIDIEKATNGHDADTPPGPGIIIGDPVTWTYVVTNTGNEELTDITVTDDQLGPICVAGSLDPGSSFTCTATGTATTGPYANVGTAEAIADGGRTISDSDPSHYFGNQPPDCSGAVASPASLWPPNHSVVSIDVIGVTDPDGDPVTITIDSIFQDEPVDDNGDGSFEPDGSGVGTSTAQVRAERNGKGNGRVYHISFTADDGNGATCSGEVLVGVPHDQRRQSTPVDDGALYDSTVPSDASKAAAGPVAEAVPTGYALSAAYPNPFNPTTTIRYTLPEATHVQVAVYDVLGQKVRTLVNRHQKAGRYEVTFDAAHLSSGIYLYVLEAGSFRQVKAMSLMK